MGMPQTVWGQPGFLAPAALAGAAEELGQGGGAEWVVSTPPAPANEKKKGARRIRGTLCHDIGVHRVQCDRFMEVDDAFHPAFRADSLGMVTAPPHDHAAAAIGD